MASRRALKQVYLGVNINGRPLLFSHSTTTSLFHQFQFSLNKGLHSASSHSRGTFPFKDTQQQRHGKTCLYPSEVPPAQHRPIWSALATPQAHSQLRFLNTTCLSRCKETEMGFDPMKKSLGSLERRLAIQFTCKVCNNRQTKTFTKHAYEKGIVIVECDGCKNRHLIADNLGWFNHIEARNIEEMMEQKGEKVKRYMSEGLLEIPSGDSQGKPEDSKE